MQLVLLQSHAAKQVAKVPAQADCSPVTADAQLVFSHEAQASWVDVGFLHVAAPPSAGVDESPRGASVGVEASVGGLHALAQEAVWQVFTAPSAAVHAEGAAPKHVLMQLVLAQSHAAKQV